VNVVEDTLARPLAENPHILQRVFKKLPRHKKVSRKSLVLDWAVRFQGNRRYLFGFELFGHFTGEFFNLIG
jgi:hypothetical protein